MLKRIYNAIKSDDEKTFTAFMVQENCFSYSFGRFPILSLCYMFKSYKILDKYEKKLLPISKYIVVQEYGEIYLKFKKLAKKSIRFFVAENQRFVYPIYILALTGDNDTINRHYDIIYKNAEINEVLGKIYANLGENHTKIAVNKFVSKQNKHSFFQKLFITIACLVMCLMLAFPIFSFYLLVLRSDLLYPGLALICLSHARIAGVPPHPCQEVLGMKTGVECILGIELHFCCFLDSHLTGVKLNLNKFQK